MVVCLKAHLGVLARWQYVAFSRASEPFGGRLPKLSMHFEEILLLVCENFVDQNTVFESSINFY